MKKYIPLLILCLLTINAKSQRFKGGIIGGLNATQIDGDRLAGYNNAGLVAGAYVFTEFNEKFNGQLEIKYAGKGSSTPKDAVAIQKIRLNYIDLPILIGYNILNNLKLQAGISFNYLFKARYYDGAWMDDFTQPPHSIETAIQAGINYSFFKAFDMNIRYNYSMLPVRAKTSGSSFMDETAWFNNVLSFCLYFQIGK